MTMGKTVFKLEKVSYELSLLQYRASDTNNFYLVILHKTVLSRITSGYLFLSQLQK